MKDEKTVVVVQRGCTCCGTGCVLAGLVIPGATFALWSTAGAVVEISTIEGRIAPRLLEEEDGPMLDLLKKAHATAI